MRYKILTIIYGSGKTETIEIIGNVEYTNDVLMFQLREPLLNDGRNIERYVKLNRISEWTVEYVQ